MNDRGVFRSLDAHRPEIDAAIEAGAKQVEIARALGVKASTFSSWLTNRDLGQPQADDEAREALRRLAESVNA